MKKTNAYVVAISVIAVAAIVICSFYFVTKQNNQDRFTVTGSATVYAKADVANLTVGMKTEVKDTAAEATMENSEKINKILLEVKNLGVEEKDIKTTNYRLNPVYNWTEKNGQELEGYQVTQSVTLKIRELDKIGEIISKTTQAGANQVGDISFTIDDEFELKNEARELAIDKAKEKAQLIAQQSGLKLGKIKGVNENNYAPVAYAYSNARVSYDMAEGGEMAESSNIEAGQNEIRSEVTLIYEVK